MPHLFVGAQVASEPEAERALVDANRELIARMEAKIKAKLAEIWGEEEDGPERTPLKCEK